MYKLVPLKTKEILNVEAPCHAKDMDRTTSLICTFVKSRGENNQGPVGPRPLKRG